MTRKYYERTLLPDGTYERTLLPDGTYDAVIRDCEEVMSKSGTPMLKVTLRIPGAGRDAWVNDYVMLEGPAAWRLAVLYSRSRSVKLGDVLRRVHPVPDEAEAPSRHADTVATRGLLARHEDIVALAERYSTITTALGFAADPALQDRLVAEREDLRRRMLAIGAARRG